MEEEIEYIEMRIIDDGKQMSVRLPKAVTESLSIDPKRDVFVFVFDKNNLTLQGTLEDKKIWDEQWKVKNQQNKE